MSDQLRIRESNPEDLPFLEEMLFECFHWRSGLESPSFAEFRQQPEFQKLIEDWGRPGDTGLIAELAGAPIGAAWYRFWTNHSHADGYFSAKVPELELAVRRDSRRQGHGRALLQALLDRAFGAGIPALSLSVDPRNPARGLFESCGFIQVRDLGDSWTMVLDAILAKAMPR